MDNNGTQGQCHRSKSKWGRAHRLKQGSRGNVTQAGAKGHRTIAQMQEESGKDTWGRIPVQGHCGRAVARTQGLRRRGKGTEISALGNGAGTNAQQGHGDNKTGGKGVWKRAQVQGYEGKDTGARA